MKQIRDHIKKHTAEALNRLLAARAPDAEPIRPEQLVLETPPDPALGDIGIPMFPFARFFKTAPAEISKMLCAELEKTFSGGDYSFETAGPYVNVRIKRETYTGEVIEGILSSGDSYGANSRLAGVRMVIEFSCPNTNKPLHLGHLRNDAIGESLARIAERSGAEVRKVNLINDRGIHICKSMLAYERFGGGVTPESEGMKSDHFVGNYYVAFNKWASEDPSAEEAAREMLRSWEKGEGETVELWNRMNRWAIEGIEETYRKTGISFDTVYFESRTYTLGKNEVLKGLEKGIFTKDGSGTVWADLDEADLGKKVLLRGDGTSLYVTQDIGTALQRHRDWPFDTMVYVVGSEQQYHFQVLFEILKMLGYNWAENLYHLSYGMVNLTEGKMKSREGTVVDADDLLEELSALALDEIREKGREEDIQTPEKTAERIALGALHFYLLQATPSKDMIFQPQKSISFTGSTGPYLQYTCARISSMLGKYRDREEEFSGGCFSGKLLTVPEEWEIVKLLGLFPETVAKACAEMNPSLITAFLYDLAKLFSQYYHDNPVLHNEDPNLVVTRITLSRAVLQVMRNGMYLINVPFLSSM